MAIPRVKRPDLLQCQHKFSALSASLIIADLLLNLCIKKDDQIKETHRIVLGMRVKFKGSPNKECARLLFSMYSYTKSICFPSIQLPCNFTKFGCCKAEIMPISVTNSRFPCFDFEDSCLTAIIVPSNNTPCDEKWHSCQIFIYTHTQSYRREKKITKKIKRVEYTLYTDPNPPSPILFAALKLSVAALICLNVKKPVLRSNPLRTVKVTSSQNLGSRLIKLQKYGRE